MGKFVFTLYFKTVAGTGTSLFNIIYCNFK